MVLLIKVAYLSAPRSRQWSIGRKQTLGVRTAQGSQPNPRRRAAERSVMMRAKQRTASDEFASLRKTNIVFGRDPTTPTDEFSPRIKLGSGKVPRPGKLREIAWGFFDDNPQLEDDVVDGRYKESCENISIRFIKFVSDAWGDGYNFIASRWRGQQLPSSLCAHRTGSHATL